MLPKARERDEVIWKDLVYRMAKQVKCSVSENWKRKRPNCSVKIRTIKLRKKWSFTKGFSYTLLQTSTWQAMAEGICTDKVSIDENIFATLFTNREVLDSIAVELTLLGFDDLVKIAEKRLAR